LELKGLTAPGVLELKGLTAPFLFLLPVSEWYGAKIWVMWPVVVNDQIINWNKFQITCSQWERVNEAHHLLRHEFHSRSPQYSQIGSICCMEMGFESVCHQ
jgi:hypothetical protein